MAILLVRYVVLMLGNSRHSQCGGSTSLPETLPLAPSASLAAAAGGASLPAAFAKNRKEIAGVYDPKETSFYSTMPAKKQWVDINGNGAWHHGADLVAIGLGPAADAASAKKGKK